jgi:hypothetical protein
VNRAFSGERLAAPLSDGLRALNERDASQREAFHQVAVSALRQHARVQRAPVAPEPERLQPWLFLP